ncbi:hypothetical protein B0T20DRAFT_385801 [Sordaria brevicollis]|uniref:Uncharacterized protein n=1 Tax=Sordaria brevicollis TaxID=83679 RepID=A0AAE0NWJ5_SORBR|nr:hypothetical protein B0T20DRAFT_385801 [Sordaria brevicollis]
MAYSTPPNLRYGGTLPSFALNNNGSAVPKSRSDIRQSIRPSTTRVMVEPVGTRERPWLPSDGLYQELNKTDLHERKLAILGIDDRLLRPLPITEHPLRFRFDYIPFRHDGLRAFSAIEAGVKSVVKKLGVEALPGVSSLGEAVPKQVRDIRESGWRPTQLGFEHIRWPSAEQPEREWEFQSEWYEILWYDLMRRVYRWTEKYFEEGRDVNVGAKSVRDWSNLWKQAGVSDHFVHYASLVARQDNNHPAGWDVLLAKGTHRKLLMAGVLVRVLQEQVWDDLLFGADRNTKRMLEAQDECYIDMDGYARTELRSQAVRTALGEYILTPNFWPAVDKLAIQTTALFSPMLKFISNEFEIRIDPLEFHQDIHDIVAEAGYFNIAMRLSRDVFRFNWPLPGDGWSTEIENVDDVPFEISRAWADKHEHDAHKRYHAGLEAERRRQKKKGKKDAPKSTVAKARGALGSVLGGASSTLKSGLSATASTLARLRPGFVAPTIVDPAPSDPYGPKSLEGPELYLPSRLAKTQIAVFPAVQRYVNQENTYREPIKKAPFSRSSSFQTNDLLASIESHPTYEYYFDRILPRFKTFDSSPSFKARGGRGGHENPYVRQQDAMAIHTIAKGNAIYYSGVADESQLSSLRINLNDPNAGPEKYYTGYPGYMPEHSPTLREWTNLPLTKRHAKNSFGSQSAYSQRTSSSLLTRVLPSTRTLVFFKRLFWTLAILGFLRFVILPFLFPSLLPFVLALESTVLHVVKQIRDFLAPVFSAVWRVLGPVLSPVINVVKRVMLGPLSFVLRALGYIYGKLRGFFGRWGDWFSLVDDRVRGGLERADAWLAGKTGTSYLPESWRRRKAAVPLGKSLKSSVPTVPATTITTTTTTTTEALADAAGRGFWNPFGWGQGSELKTETTTYTTTTNWDDEVFTRTDRKIVRKAAGLTSEKTSTLKTSTVTTGWYETYINVGEVQPPPPVTD